MSRDPLAASAFQFFRGASGTLSFEVNDFDDVGYGPLDLDLRRLCTSALLLPGLSPGVRAARAAVEFAENYALQVESDQKRSPGRAAMSQSSWA